MHARRCPEGFAGLRLAKGKWQQVARSDLRSPSPDRAHPFGPKCRRCVRTENCERANKRKHNRGNFSGSLFTLTNCEPAERSLLLFLLLSVCTATRKPEHRRPVRYLLLTVARAGKCLSDCLNCIVCPTRCSPVSRLSALLLSLLRTHTPLNVVHFIYHHNHSVDRHSAFSASSAGVSDSHLMTFLASNAIDDDHLCLLSAEQWRGRSGKDLGSSEDLSKERERSVHWIRAGL